MQRHYELALLADFEQAEQAHELAEQCSSMITGAGGAVHRLEHWGRRNLAYPIRKQGKAFYVLLNIECDAKTRDELQRSLHFNENVLRHLLIRRAEAITETSPLARQRKENSARDSATEAPAQTNDDKTRDELANKTEPKGDKEITLDEGAPPESPPEKLPEATAAEAAAPEEKGTTATTPADANQTPVASSETTEAATEEAATEEAAENGNEEAATEEAAENGNEETATEEAAENGNEKTGA